MAADSTRLSVSSSGHANQTQTQEPPAKSRLVWNKVKRFAKKIPGRIPEITISRAVFYSIFLIYHFAMLGIYLRGTSDSLPVRMYFINDLAMDIIMLDLAIALLAQCQETMRFLRLTFLPRFINFERNLAVHRLTGLFVVKFSLIHTVGEYKGLYEVSRSFFSRHTYRYYLIERVSGWTGHVLLVLLLAMMILAIGPIRRKRFELFRYSHTIIFVIVIPMLYVHGKERRKIHKYVSAPLALFVLDKGWRYIRRIRGFARIEWVRFFPGCSAEVRFSGPGFRFRHGQHIRVNCPSVSRFQWHPFTLVSDPKDREGYTFQLKVRGDWTLAFAKRLGAPEWFVKECTRSKSKDAKGKSRRNSSGSDRSSRRSWDEDATTSSKLGSPRITVHHSDGTAHPPYSVVGETHDLPSLCIDGPYTGSVEFASTYKQVILVAGGNGMNSMVSFLYSAAGRLQESANDPHGQPLIDLIWVVRTTDCFSWYPDLWRTVKDAGLNVALHLYYTREDDEEEQRGDSSQARASESAQIDFAENQSIDEVSNGEPRQTDVQHNDLGTATFGRPPLREVIGEVAKMAPHRRIGVFICGPPGLCKDTSKAAHHWGYRLLRKQRTWLEVHDEPY
ncbi:hypothetical protein GQ54DRAFT_177843 [Martensiomyces pterosporus]|nr:hypothetical protein GQ54DRAFT_177843 [Martensiomyces pterosporus]